MKKIFLSLLFLSPLFSLKAAEFEPTKENCTEAFISLMQAIHAQEVIDNAKKDISKEVEKLYKEQELKQKQTNNELYEWYLKGEFLGINQGNTPTTLQLNKAWNNQHAKYAIALWKLKKCLKQNMLPNNFKQRAQEKLAQENIKK